MLPADIAGCSSVVVVAAAAAVAAAAVVAAVAAVAGGGCDVFPARRRSLELDMTHTKQ